MYSDGCFCSIFNGIFNPRFLGPQDSCMAGLLDLFPGRKSIQNFVLLLLEGFKGTLAPETALFGLSLVLEGPWLCLRRACLDPNSGFLNILLYL
jgi:hypothetical protein